MEFFFPSVYHGMGLLNLELLGVEGRSFGPGGVAGMPKGYSEKGGLEDYQPWQNNSTQRLGETRAEKRQKTMWF